MKRLVAALILVPLAIVIVALSVANRHAVTLSLDPFNADAPAAAIAMPLYVLIFAAIALGVLLGGVGTWLGQGRWRRQARTLKREAKSAGRDDRSRAPTAAAIPATLLPVTRRDAA